MALAALGAEPDPLIRQIANAKPGETVRVRTGFHPGPFVIPPGVRLVGEVGAVLSTSGQGEGVRVEQDASLEELTLLGGQFGLIAHGHVTLRSVRFEDSLKSALVMEGGQLSGENLRFETLRSGTNGVVLQGNAQGTLSHTDVQGPYRRAFGVEHASLRLSDTKVHQSPSQRADVDTSAAETVVQAIDSEVTIERLNVHTGAGPALFISGGHAVLEKVDIEGHEYGLLLRHHAEVQLRTFHSRGSKRAGIAQVGSVLAASGIRIERSGNLGAIQSSESVLTMTDFTLREGSSYGIIATGGTVHLQSGDVDDVKGPIARAAEGADKQFAVRSADDSNRGPASEPGVGPARSSANDSGEGLHFARVFAVVRHLRIARASGPCLIALEETEVHLDHVRFEACGEGALEAASQSRINARQISIGSMQGAALRVAEGAQVAMLGWHVEQSGHGVFETDCAEEVRVYVDAIEGETQDERAQRPSCIRPFNQRPRKSILW